MSKPIDAIRRFPTLDSLDVKGKTVLVRLDLNVPMQAGRVTDATRITRQLPTVQDLLTRGAKVVIISHFGQPKGAYDPALSLSPLVDALSKLLGQEVRFGVDCIGPSAKHAVDAAQPGDVVLLENLRFHTGETKNDPEFSKALADLADCFVNDAFSCAHRAHASMVGVSQHLPFAAGRMMQAELEHLEALFAAPERPLAAVVGGAKVSSKLAVLEHLTEKVDMLIIGGAMANTFLLAQGHSVGKSLCEPDLVETAKRILAKAANNGCRIILPQDVVATREFAAHAASRIVAVDAIAADEMALDIGPLSVAHIISALAECKTVLWNGPMGAFETAPFDASTVLVARAVALLTGQKKMHSVAGGGDTVAALSHAGLFDGFSYLSTAGGAFLEWMEGRPLPGVAALAA
jgi:phosphoglycerate kinase